MAMETLILAHNNQFNQEVCENTTLYFKDSDELKDVMDDIESNIESYIPLKLEASKRIKKEYSWEKISSEYNQLFELKIENKEIEPVISESVTHISDYIKSK